MLYKLSDGVSFLLYHLVGYRKKLVLKNLKIAFPYKSEHEIKQIAKKSYTNLADILLETLKGFSISKEELEKRFVVEVPDYVDRYYEEGRSGIGVGPHYGNWEWGALRAGSVLPFQMIGFYKPIKNKKIDYFLRERLNKEFGLQTESIKKTYLTFRKNKNIPSAYLMIADQSPSNTRKAIWLDFLNQDTAVIHGVEKYARTFNLSVYFFEIERVKRGYYEATFREIVANPNDYEEGEVTKIFMHEIEKQILAKPENWLWTHNRWKRKRPTNENQSV